MTDQEKFKLLSTKIISVDFDHTLSLDGNFSDIGRPNTKRVFSRKEDKWETPQWLFNRLYK